MTKKLLFVLAVSTLFCAPAKADIGPVTFSGTIASTCTLVVTNGSGTLVPATNLLNLSSKNSGGVPGTLSISTTGGVNLSVDPATAPIQPSSDLNSTIWAPSYSVSGLQTIVDATAATPLVSPGTGTVIVNLTATKAAGASFHTGTYGATVTVRCGP